jgi:hypothetical protein
MKQPFPSIIKLFTMVKKLLLIAFAIGFLTPLGAQLSWKKHRDLAEQAFQQGNFAEAAENFEQAWRKKQKRTELAFKAGESYYLLRDYRKAAESYQHVKDKNDVYPLVGLKYARSLKQDGQYDKAAQEFRSFSNSYTGENKAILEDIIRTEVLGCQLGKDLPSQINRDVELLYPGKGVNSDMEEFAPFPISDDELYFSSARGDKARIYASRRVGRTWSEAAIPGNFPVIQNNHFCNGALAPDGQRFYFTICSGDQPWDNLKTRCEIFAVKRSGAGWSQPERLPDYVNMKGVTSTHPTVAHSGGREVIYYASNREGGRGGLDLWYISRDLGIDNNDFTFPVNLGPTINTLGDEITPFYDPENEMLYFSSNGHVSIGGFDVMQARGEEINWSVAENTGLPINSSADDYFYIKNRTASGGFLVSNRVFGGEKTNTRNADIFEFTVGGRRIMVKGTVYDQTTSAPLNDITVSLYQVFNDGAENMLISKSFSDGTYSFELLPDRRFKVQITSYGYSPFSYQFATNDPSVYTYGQPAYLRKTTAGQPTPVEPAYPDAGTDRPTAGASGAPLPLMEGSVPGATYTSRATAHNDNFEYVTSAPRYRGVYYKIQLAAVGNYEASKFQSVSGIGRVDTEKLTSRELTRVLVGDFFSERDAIRAMESAKKAGYSGAYVVKYEDGARFGKVTIK